MKNTRGTRLLVLTTLLGLSIGLAACGSSTQSGYDNPKDGVVAQATPEPAPAPAAEPAPVVEDNSMMEGLFIQTYRDEYDAGEDDATILGYGQTACAEFLAALDAGKTFTDYIMESGMTVEDPTKFGYVLGSALVSLCPEAVDHPNYD